MSGTGWKATSAAARVTTTSSRPVCPPPQPWRDKRARPNKNDGEGRPMAADGIGTRLVRKEDYRFLTGAGHYTDDINRPGQAYAYFLRSPHAHARIGGIDKAAAEQAPGVLAV